MTSPDSIALLAATVGLEGDRCHIVVGMRRMVVVVLASTVLAQLAALGVYRQEPSAKAGATASEERLKAAEEVWKTLARSEEWGDGPGTEARYRWSRRLLEASRGTDPSTTASATHLKRMEDLRDRLVRLVSAGRSSGLDAKMARYYVAEAKVWVEEAPR